MLDVHIYKYGCIGCLIFQHCGFRVICVSIQIKNLNLSSCDDIPACEYGKYGVECAHSCNCGPNVEACDPATGCTICRDGWTGDNCTTNIDECATNTYNCTPHSTCKNLPQGTYSCVCNNYYEKDPEKGECVG